MKKSKKTKKSEKISLYLYFFLEKFGGFQKNCVHLRSFYIHLCAREPEKAGKMCQIVPSGAIFNNV
jgi:hypothetical protein